MQTTPEGELIKQVAEHWSDSFTRLYDQYMPLICKIWYQYHLDDVPLDDWKQEAAMVLYRSACSYQDKQVRFCWYYRQALLNKIRDLYRQQSAQKRVPFENMEPITDLHIDQHLVDVAFRPDEISQFRLVYQQFLKDCSGLEKKVFLAINAGEQLEAIANQLSCSPMSIRSAFERARQKFLKQIFDWFCKLVCTDWLPSNSRMGVVFNSVKWYSYMDKEWW